jgi:hypothetical protein
VTKRGARATREIAERDSSSEEVDTIFVEEILALLRLAIRDPGNLAFLREFRLVAPEIDRTSWLAVRSHLAARGFAPAKLTLLDTALSLWGVR